MLLGNIHSYTLHSFTHVAVGEFAKCYVYAKNGTHERVKKGKRAMIISLIIALGFTFGESLHLTNGNHIKNKKNSI